MKRIWNTGILHRILCAGILLCIPFLLLPVLSGCTEVYDPSSVLYPSEAGLEKTADGYLVSVRIGEDIYRAAGSTFREAAELMDLESGGSIFWKTVRVWLLSDDLSEEELLPFFEELMYRDPLMQCYLVTALSPVSELLSVEQREGQLADMVKNGKGAEKLKLLTVFSLLARGKTPPTPDSVTLRNGALFLLPCSKEPASAESCSKKPGDT